MKTLIVIRHGKSSWDDPKQADFDRPLNGRGERDVPFMGGQLMLRGLLPELIVSSTAVRAARTAKLIAKAVGYDKAAIDFRQELYLAEPETLMNAVGGLDDARQRVALIAHNPGLTDLVNRLCGENIDNLPTTGIAVIEFAIDTWAAVMAGAGRLVLFDYPKRHR